MTVLRSTCFRKFSINVSLYPHLTLLHLQDFFTLTPPESGVFLINLVERHVSEAAVHWGRSLSYQIQIHLNHYMYSNPAINPYPVLNEQEFPPPPLSLNWEIGIISASSLFKLKNITKSPVAQSVNIYGVTFLGQKLCLAVGNTKMTKNCPLPSRENVCMNGDGHVKRWV